MRSAGVAAGVLEFLSGQMGGGLERTRISDLYRLKVRRSITCRQAAGVFNGLGVFDWDSFGRQGADETILEPVWTPHGLVRHTFTSAIGVVLAVSPSGLSAASE